MMEQVDTTAGRRKHNTTGKQGNEGQPRHVATAFSLVGAPIFRRLSSTHPHNCRVQKPAKCYQPGTLAGGGAQLSSHLENYEKD